MIDKWNDARKWYDSYDNETPLSVGSMIRNVAIRSIEDNMVEGQGIGSSDVNHEIYSMYLNWESYVVYCTKEKSEPNIITFLLSV